MSHPVHRRRALLAAVTFGLIAFGASLPGRFGPRKPATGAARADEAQGIFHGVGTVTGVDADGGALSVDHGAIPGFMDAMEMTYKVRPAGLVAGLKKGDRIAFAIEGSSYTIVEISKVEGK